MRTINFAKRNFKELIRDPMGLVFSIALPLFLLVIFQQFKIPNEVYSLENFTPSIIIFSYAFITLFSAELIAKDRKSSLLSRLFASPMDAYEYLLGYVLALFPIVLIQNILFFIVAILLGLSFSINIIFTILVLIPIALLFIALGILVGCLTSDKQASGLGSIVVQLVAFTSGMWFSIDMVGKVYGTICNILPFSYTVNLARTFLIGNREEVLLPIIIILGYTIAIFAVASLIFTKKMQNDLK